MAGFLYRSAGEQLFGGSQEVIVNKRIGKVFRLGSAFPVQRDLELYERGYQFETFSAVEPSYEGGTVWRIPRRLTREELRSRLATLPAVFGELKLYFHAEALERARASEAFRFELLEYRP